MTVGPTRARIFKRSKSAMQSGAARVEEWEIAFPPRTGDGKTDTRSQVRLRFESKEEAIAYADRHGIAYDLEIPPAPPQVKPKVYADNFRFGRTENWTH